MTPVIDSHHHFWHYTPQEYGWIGENMRPLRRDFLPEDLHKEIRQAGVDGVVSVQARQSVAETEWLLGFARQNDWIRGVVGWVPLVDAGVPGMLERFAGNAKLKGIRHVIQDEADERFILREDFGRGVAATGRAGLVYDILIFERHLPHAIHFVDKYPKQTFVLDHIAKPRIKEKMLEPWATNIREISKRANVYCKLSGMVTEADWQHWTEADLHPYIQTVLETFGPKRVMFGSDWPVCLAATTYSRWPQIVKAEISKLSQSEQQRVLGLTAVEAYKL